MAMVENVQFRPAGLDDIPVLCGLLGTLFTLEADFQPDANKQAHALGQLIAGNGADQETPSALVWIAQAGQQVIGMCTVQVHISTAEGGKVGLVEDVIVAEAYRQHGIGQAMLSGLEQWSKQQGLTRLQLLADSHNHRALAFYTHHGWHQTQLVALRKSLED